MAPPRQVAAPPKGSTSVGWLWVSFLNMSSQGSTPRGAAPFSTSTIMEQALISLETSWSSRHPAARMARAGSKAMSMRHSGCSASPSPNTSRRRSR